MTETAEQAGGLLAAPAAPPNSGKRGSSIGRFTRAILLYGLGGFFMMTSPTLLGKQRTIGLSFLGAAARGVAQQRTERERLAVELAAQKHALQKRLQALIDAEAYRDNRVVTGEVNG
ncbi:hypothetical protein PMI07_001404 [Rhizobium sp. CF080]|uniref:hypothetical protein n=1 Tax=Rhizobium sp. (strain CF080) TaxID=1144310 RepID=UPI000271780A|nr:hypothetical protein [Rhizobium sp. CF080]EUB96505.1 hypothetical protein PMI07_001404 [Rhizobium sp. CF080]